MPNPNAVNQMGSTAKKRLVPGVTDASYAIELLPKTGQSSCSTSNPVGTMLESSGVNTGSFRIRSTGFVGNAKASIVATFKRASLLDYIYFTQLETSDPVTYGYPNPSAALTGAYSQCSKFLREGRQSAAIPGTGGERLLHPDRVRHRRRDRGPPAHQRRPADLRHAHIRPLSGRRDRGQLAAPGLGLALWRR